MMSFTDAKNVLEKQEGGSELWEAVLNHVQKEVKTAVDAETAKGKGIAKDYKEKLEKANAILKETGFDPTSESYASIAIKLKEKLINADESKDKLGSTEKQLLDMKTSITALQDQLAAANKENTTFQTKLNQEKIKGVLSKKLSHFYSSELHVTNLIESGKVSLNENGELIYKDGEQVIDLDAGLKKYESEHKDSIKNSQTVGGGGGPTDFDVNQKVMKRSDFDRLPPEKQAAFMVAKDSQLVD